MGQVRLPLSDETRRIIENYLAGLKLDPASHMRLAQLRKRLKNVDLDQVIQDVKLLKRFLVTRRRA